MTPPNELEQLAQFQDAIQSDEGLERLRAMQYLQQMNNQGIMGLPQVTQQPVVQRKEPGPIFKSNYGEIGNPVLDQFNPRFDMSGESGSDMGLLKEQKVMADQEEEERLLSLNPNTRENIDAAAIAIVTGEGDLKAAQEIFDANPEAVQERINQLRGGPVVNKFMGGNFANIFKQVKDSDAFKPTENKGTPQVISTSVPFIGGSGIATPDPNISQKQAIVNLRNMKGGFGDIISSGMANAFEQGLMSLPSRGAEGLKETVNYQETQEDPISSPQAMNDEIVNTQGENVPFNFGAARFLSNAGGPVPLRENTQEGIRNRATLGGIVETPRMAEQGGYIQNLAGGGLIQGRELQQLQEGGLVNLPVVNMGLGGLIRSVFRAPVNLVKGIAKGAKKIVKSKAFKSLAPLVLAVAAPYALGALAPSVFGAGATALGGALSTSGALGYGIATGLGSMAGNLLGGARFGDAARQGLMSGATGGLFKGLGSGNWMGTGNPAAVANAGKLTQVGPGAKNIQAGTQVAKAPVTGGNPFAAAQQAKVAEQAAQQAAEVSKIGSNILTTPGGPEGYVGGLKPTITAEGVPTNIAQNLSTPKFSNIQFTTEGVPSAPEATRTGFFGKGPLSNTGGTLGGEGYTGSTFDKIKQVGKNIYADYANPRGVAKLVGMDLMQPNWDEVYASEEAMEQQLQDMGYTIDTGFGGTKVYRDAAGKTLPSNLTAEQALNIALGRTPRTRLYDRIGFEPNASEFVDKAQGGLVSLAHGGEFSGKVEGDGHGMEDNVYMPIVEKGQGQQIGTLAVSPSEYVVDAHTMSALGNGNADEGAKVMDSVIAGVRKKAFGTTQQPKEIDGLNALMPMMERA